MEQSGFAPELRGKYEFRRDFIKNCWFKISMGIDCDKSCNSKG